MNTTELYFAFGSNLSIGQMKRRCPGAEVEGTAVIDGYRLVFAGRSALWGGAVATLLAERGAQTEGVLYRLPPADLIALDAYEGHPGFYQRRSLRVTDEDGHTLRAHVYLLAGQPLGMPSGAYYCRIADAYQRLGFDQENLRAAVWLGAEEGVANG